jgi:hypothetical protein
MRTVRTKRRFEIIEGRCGNTIVLKDWKRGCGLDGFGSR